MVENAKWRKSKKCPEKLMPHFVFMELPLAGTTADAG